MKQRIWVGYPSVLGRIPLFLPQKRKRSPIKEPLVCSWGTVVFPDLPLAVYDEDVLIAVMNCGKWDDVYGTIIYKEKSLNALARHMRKTPSNVTTKLIMESLKALRCLQVELIDACGFNFKGTVFSDMQVVNGAVEVVLDSKIAGLLGQSRRIDLNIRKQLTPTGKALHRFLSCHPIEKEFYIDTIHNAVAPCKKRKDHFKSVLIEELKKLKGLRFLKDYEIEKHGKVWYARQVSRAPTRNIWGSTR